MECEYNEGVKDSGKERGEGGLVGASNTQMEPGTKARIPTNGEAKRLRDGSHYDSASPRSKAPPSPFTCQRDSCPRDLPLLAPVTLGAGWLPHAFRQLGKHSDQRRHMLRALGIAYVRASERGTRAGRQQHCAASRASPVSCGANIAPRASLETSCVQRVYD